MLDKIKFLEEKYFENADQKQKKLCGSKTDKLANTRKKSNKICIAIA